MLNHFRFGMSIDSTHRNHKQFLDSTSPREFVSQFPTPNKHRTSGVAARLLQKRRNSFSKRSRRRNKWRCPTCGWTGKARDCSDGNGG